MIRPALRAAWAEALKLKRTLALAMAFVAPALVALLGIFSQSNRLSRGGAAASFWDSYSRESLGIWAIFVMPLLITLETALLCGIEHGERQWKHLFALPVPRPALFAAKYVAVHGLVLLGSAVVCVLIVLSGWAVILWHPALAAAGAPPVGSMAARALGCWLAAGLILSLHLWVALRWPSFAVASGAGIAGTFFALFAASARVGKYYPWLLPVNMLAAPDRPPVALALGIGGGLLVAGLGCLDFSRREEGAPPGLGRTATALGVLAAAGLLAVAVRLQSAPGPSPLVEARIARVERGLVPAVSLSGGPAGPATLPERMKLYGVPGVSVAVLRAGAIEWTKAYGVRQAGGRDPVTEDTRFQAGSISKPVAAMTALALVQQGALALDEDVDDRLRSWKLPASPYTSRAKVTLRRLLSHTAGLPADRSEGYSAAEPMPGLADVLLARGAAGGVPARVEAEPGSRFRYSGVGYAVVQQLIEDATGRAFADVARELVLAKLGMERSAFSQPLRADWALLSASGHTPDGAPYPGRWRNQPVLAAAGLWSTPSDIARFAIEVRRAARGEAGRVLSRPMAELMTTRLAGSYGSGLQLVGGPGGTAVAFQHGGATPGYRCLMVCRLERGEGAVVMTNGDGGAVLIEELLRSLAREYGWPSREPSSRTVVPVDEAKLGEYAGRYRSAEAVLTVEVEGGRLYLSAPELSGGRWELHPVGPDLFLLAEENEEVSFSRDARGLVDGLRSEGEGERFSAARTAG